MGSAPARLWVWMAVGESAQLGISKIKQLHLSLSAPEKCRRSSQLQLPRALSGPASAHPFEPAEAEGMDLAVGPAQATRIGPRVSLSAAAGRVSEMGGLGAVVLPHKLLTIVILGVGLSAKPDLKIETWAHPKALERLELESTQPVESD